MIRQGWPATRKEDVRRAALDRLGAVRADADAVLQELTDDVRVIFGVDLVVVHLMLSDSLYFRAWSGPLPQEFVESREIQAEQSMCPNVMETEAPLVVRDLAATDRFKDHFVCAVGGLRFYAGTPLFTSGGEAIGTLCLLGVEPREFGEGEVITLSAFARAVVGRLELLGALGREQAVSEEEARRSRELQRVLDESLDIIATIGFDGTIKTVNRACAPVLGYDPAELVGSQYMDLVHPEDRPSAMEAAKRLYRGEPVALFQSRYVRKDGGSAWIEWSATPLPEEGIYHCVARDTTDRKLAEEALRRQRDLYGSLLDAQSAVGEGFVIIEDQRIVYANEAFVGISGYSSPELLALSSLFELIPPEERHASRERMRQRLTGRRAEPQIEVTMLHKSGKLVALEVGMKLLTRSDGIRFILVIRDVTERKQVEAERARLSDEMRLLLESTGEGIFGIDLRGRCTFINRAAADLLGREREDVIGQNMHTLVHHAYPDGSPYPEEECPISRASQTAKECRVEDGVFWHEDGSPLIVEYSAYPIVKGGETRGAVVAFSGVKERKEAEEALRESEERHRLVAETASDAIVTIDAESRILFTNRAAEKTFGYRSSRMVGQKLSMLMPESLRDAHEAGIKRYLETGRRNLDWDSIELPGLHESGREISLEVSFGEWAEDGERRFTGFIRDVTDRKETEEALRRAEEKYRSVFENVVEGIFQTSLDGRFVMVNPAMARIFGYDSPEMLISSVTSIERQLFVEPERRAELIRLMQQHGRVSDFVSQGVRRDGCVIWVSANAHVLYSAEGEVLGYEGTLEDITERRRLEEARRESEQRFRQLFEQSVDALLVHDEDGWMLDCNSEACRSLGYSREELLSLSVKDFATDVLSEEERKAGGDDTLWRRVVSAEPGEISGLHRGEHRRKDGSTFPVEVKVGAISYRGQRAAFASARDITERRLLEEQLEHQAFHDALTGLPNRALFVNRLQLALSAADRKGGVVAVLFLDMDNFKVVNDSLGHEAGDRLLVAVAERLRRCLRSHDTAARLGGDEFTVLMEDVADSGEAVGVAERITSELRAPFDVCGHEVHATTSIGISLSSRAGEQGADLMRDADTAMYRAKSRGRARYEVFEEKADYPPPRRRNLEGFGDTFERGGSYSG